MSTKSEEMNPVRGFIISHFGTYQNLADFLDVSVGTVGTWTQAKPRGLLRYLPELMRREDIRANDVVWTVQRHLQMLDS